MEIIIDSADLIRMAYKPEEIVKLCGYVTITEYARLNARTYHSVLHMLDRIPGVVRFKVGKMEDKAFIPANAPYPQREPLEEDMPGYTSLRTMARLYNVTPPTVLRLIKNGSIRKHEIFMRKHVWYIKDSVDIDERRKKSHENHSSRFKRKAMQDI